jgi:hypothetical protein
MAKREQIPPLLACRSGAPATFPALTRQTGDEGFSARRREAPPSAFAVITLNISLGLKASIGLTTEPCVSGVDYMASREERNSFSCRDISSWVRFVPIRDDSEMVVNLGLRNAEAGLRRLGVAA